MITRKALLAHYPAYARGCQMQAQHRFIELLAFKPYCSDNKGAHDIRTKEHAIKKPYIQYNPPHQCAWLIFDCDHDNISAFEDAGLPPPNWISVTPGTGRHHTAYAIDPVYTTGNARPHPLRYLAAIERTYSDLLKSDSGFSHLITKNPLHPSWSTWWLHSHVYTLGELAEYGTRKFKGKLKPKAKEEESTGYGRNVDLFDHVRRWAYQSIRQESYQTENQLHAAVYDTTLDKNMTFREPLQHSEVKSIANSVTRWVWRHRHEIIEKGLKKGKIGLNKDLPLETKQALGAAYTATIKAEASQAKVRAAKDMLMAKGVKATQKAVAAATGLSLRTVKTYWKKL